MAFNILLKDQLQHVINILQPQIHSYATSSTAKNVVSKVVTLSNFILGEGAKITVRFTDTTTTSPSSGNITLNVNNTGAKSIYKSETNTLCTYEDADNFCNNKVCEFVYDGTNWVWLINSSDSSIAESDLFITTNEFENLS